MQSHANTHNVMRRTAQVPWHMEWRNHHDWVWSWVRWTQTLNVFTVRYPQTQQGTSQCVLLLPGIFPESSPAHRSTVALSSELFFSRPHWPTWLAHAWRWATIKRQDPCPSASRRGRGHFRIRKSKETVAWNWLSIQVIHFCVHRAPKGHQGTPMVSLMVNMPHSVVIAYSTLLHGVSWWKDRQAGNSTLEHYH